MDAFSQPLYPTTELGSVGCMTSTLSGVLAKLKFIDCAYKSCDLGIAHMCYAISRLEWNLRILRIRNAISRFSDCVEHNHKF